MFTVHLKTYAWGSQCFLFLFHDDAIKGNIFGVTGPLWGESTGHPWIPLA